MTKGCIYYSDGRLVGSDILKVCQKQLRDSFKGEIVHVSLAPTDFGDKIIVLKDRVRSYPTMILQILTALENSTADWVFFTEHDVLYHPTHFDLNPEDHTKYYYNVNNWRWLWGTPTAITYDYLTSLSGMSCDRKVGIEHYRKRVEIAKELELDEHRGREPRWARRWGYEPGTKPRRRGGFSDEEHIKWRSLLPNVDIRHKRTFSKPKVTLDDFIHKPTDSWREVPIEKIEGWDVKKLFNL